MEERRDKSDRSRLGLHVHGRRAKPSKSEFTQRWARSWPLHPKEPCGSLVPRGPTWSNGAVPSEEMEASSPQTEVLDDVEDLHWLLDVADFGLFRDDQVDVHVGVDEVAVGAALHGPFDPHEAVFLGTGRADRSASCQSRAS